jgi:hypothetical protein
MRRSEGAPRGKVNGEGMEGAPEQGGLARAAGAQGGVSKI